MFNVGLRMVGVGKHRGGGSAYSFFKTITIDHTQVPSDQTDFTVLVSGTYAYLADLANGGQVQNASGYDVILSSTSTLDGSGILPFERVYWNNVTGEVEFHVKVGTVSSTVDTVIYLLYGNASVVTDQQNQAGTWSNGYTNVYHFGSPTVLTGHDSIGGLDLTTGAGSNVAAVGKIGGAVLSAANSQYSNSTTSQVGGSTGTMQFWLNSAGLSGGNANWWMASGWNVPATSGCIFRSYNAQLDVFGNNSGGFANSFFKRSNSSILTAGVWSSLALTYTGAGPTVGLYQNGASVPYSTLGGGGAVGATSVGNIWATVAPGVPLTDAATIDEMRVSNVVRSPDWITAEYNNQNNPSTFYTVT